MATAVEQRPAEATGAATEHHHVVVIGGGAAGISVAAKLRRALRGADLAVIEPSERHFYQPLWTLVGGGVFPKEKSVRSEASLIPSGSTWVQIGRAHV